MWTHVVWLNEHSASVLDTVKGRARDDCRSPLWFGRPGANSRLVRPHPPAGQNTTTAHPSPPDLERIAATYLAFWVAVDAADPDEPVVGMVGVRPPGDEVPTMVLYGRQRVVQLKRMRVAPAWQRQGIGQRLLATAIDWAREHGACAIILETTEKQAAAIALYWNAGFLPVGRSTVGVYTML